MIKINEDQEIMLLMHPKSMSLLKTFSSLCFLCPASKSFILSDIYFHLKMMCYY